MSHEHKMESPRAVKRRKLETIIESPATASTTDGRSASDGARTTENNNNNHRNAPDAARTMDVNNNNNRKAPNTARAMDVDNNTNKVPSSLNLTPSKLTPSRGTTPMSASKSSNNIGGLMARLNAKIAEQQQQPPQKSPVKPVLVQVSVDVKSSKTTLEQKLRDSFEQEQLERAAKRRPKQVQDSPSTSSYSPVKGQQPPPTVEKRKPGRPRKVIQELQPVPIDAQDENDDAPISPSKVASARKSLHLNATRQPLFTPKKSLGSSPLKPRMLKLDIQPLPTNASAQLTISCTDLKAIQSAVLDQLQSKTHTPFVGLDNEYAKITSLVHQTIVAGESNSMLVIGARGSGKTALVESILHDQAVEHADLFHVVRLNGFMHTDDKIALRDIWRQLGRDMDLEEDAASKNYADTLTTLLALLSHPEELGRSADQMTKSVIFILDEFDLFATHPRQTLLYNLFDIAQSRKAPIAVLGLTTRFDVAEHLEKRVKSRFSHRHVHLSLARDLSTFRHICQNALTPVHTESISEAGMQTWNAILNDLFTLDDFNTHIRNLYYISKSIPAFYTSMLLAICTLPLTSPEIAAPDVLARLSDTTALNYLSPPDAKLATLTSLSSLQLALLISAARLTIIHDTDTVSFALCYAEYVSLASKAKIAASAAGALVHGAGIGRVWSKEVARRAWEGLVSKELVLMEGGKGNTSVRVDVRLEEIGEAEGVDLGAVMARWCREL